MKELDQLVENFFQPKRDTLGLDQLVEMVEQVMDEAADAASKAEVSERQERGMINAINQHASEENPITVNAGDGQIENVIGAKKMEGCNQFGCEMYTDVIVHTKEGNVNVSCKGTSAPSIAGGGLLGAKALIPDIIPNFLAAAENWYLDKGYKEGDIIPDLYGKLNDRDKRIAVIGTVEIGGPIDYMYVGPMDVESSFDNGVLTLSGDLVEAEEYADVHDIYFRIRKRRNDQPFVPGEKDKNGYPVILGRSPSKGDKGRRIVFVNKVPESRDIVEF